MPIDTSPYLVRPGAALDLGTMPTRAEPLYQSKADYKKRLAHRIDRMRELQDRLYADDRHAVLVIFQAPDAAGKDSAIKHVMSGVDPQGVSVHSFKQPSREELDHDFLWRTAVRLPERGRIGIFNRSYYEEVLVVRVHPAFLDAQRLPDRPATLEALWEERYQSIRDHEAHLHRNGTRIVKFFLHLSPETQRRRFLDRLEDPQKNWKFSAGDLAERAHWDAYRAAYAEAMVATSTDASPWYVIPADDKKSARLLVSEVICDLLDGLNLRFPVVDPGDIARYREALKATPGPGA
jgi:PPK2 family polyphosphate:nucleotide phosphotransferase